MYFYFLLLPTFLLFILPMSLTALRVSDFLMHSIAFELLISYICFINYLDHNSGGPPSFLKHMMLSMDSPTHFIHSIMPWIICKAIFKLRGTCSPFSWFTCDRGFAI